MERQIRYCASEDGTQIAYCVEGGGAPLVIAPYFLECFSRDDDGMAHWQDLMQQIGAGRQVVRYDVRGTGLSQREGTGISHAGNVRDLEAVVTATGLETFDLLAWVMSSPAAIEFAAQHSANVKRLILYAGFASSTDTMPKESLAALAALSRTNWQMASQTFADMSMRQETPEVVLQVNEVWRQGLSGETFAQILEMEVDVASFLPAVKAPTLVLHRVNDSAVPIAASQRLASAIPNARLMPLKGSINYPALGDWQSLIDAITAFLEEGDPAQPEPTSEPDASPPGFRTILFTDIVGHTEMMGRLGDEAGRNVLREHERMTREALRAHDGSEVKTMGDGFMASFTSATKALECAVAMQRSFRQDSEPATETVRVRVGINAGEPIAEDDDLFGTTVIPAARIAALAEGGEILVSEAVRQIVAGKKFLLSDRGETALRGFEDPVHVYEVNWRA